MSDISNIIIFLLGAIAGGGIVMSLMDSRTSKRSSSIKKKGVIKKGKKKIVKKVASKKKAKKIAVKKKKPTKAINIKTYNKKRKSIKDQRKDKVVAMIKKQKAVTNDDVQKLLKVSDSTATNYLQALENEGKVKQVGKKGRFVWYRLK